MDLQVCEPDLATASPSAIAGCTDKLEFCKVPMGAQARTCVQRFVCAAAAMASCV